MVERAAHGAARPSSSARRLLDLVPVEPGVPEEGASSESHHRAHQPAGDPIEGDRAVVGPEAPSRARASARRCSMSAVEGGARVASGAASGRGRQRSQEAAARRASATAPKRPRCRRPDAPSPGGHTACRSEPEQLSPLSPHRGGRRFPIGVGRRGNGYPPGPRAPRPGAALTARNSRRGPRGGPTEGKTWDVKLYTPQDFSKVRGLSRHLRQPDRGAPQALRGLREAHQRAHREALGLAKEGKAAGADPVYAELTRRLGFEYDGMVNHEYYFDNLTAGAQAEPPSGSEAGQGHRASFGEVRDLAGRLPRRRHHAGHRLGDPFQDPATGWLSNHWITLHRTTCPSASSPSW